MHVERGRYAWGANVQGVNVQDIVALEASHEMLDTLIKSVKKRIAFNTVTVTQTSPRLNKNDM